MWKRADAILEHATTPNARFFGLSILEVGTVAAASQPSPGASELADVREALAGLGYGADEIQVALKGLTSDGDASVLLKQALQRLAVNS